MSYKHFLITELEKKDILKKYDIITEAVDPKPVSSLVINKIVKFPAGYWSEGYVKPIIGPEIDKISKYLQSSAGKIFLVSVIISSSESQIPNVDAEAGNKAVAPLYLAQKRNDTIAKYITDQLKSFVDKKLLIELPKFKVSAPKVGPTPWVGTPFCPQGATDEQQRGECKTKFKAAKTTTYADYAKKYEDEQNIQLYIKLVELTGMKKCLDSMVIEVNYSDLSKRHTCNSAIYEIFFGGVKLTRDDGKKYASLNNDFPNSKNYPGLGDYDNNPKSVGGVRTNKFIVTPEMANQILTKTIANTPSTEGTAPKPVFSLAARCINPYNNADWKGGCHTGVGNIVVTNGLGQVFRYESSTPNEKNTTKNLATFDACGSGKSA
jgi:hypothetical protein